MNSEPSKLNARERALDMQLTRIDNVKGRAQTVLARLCGVREGLLGSVPRAAGDSSVGVDKPYSRMEQLSMEVTELSDLMDAMYAEVEALESI